MGEYWQCPGCYSIDEVPCWSPEACLVCGEPYDGSGWSQPDVEPEPVIYDDPEEVHDEVVKKQGGKRHKPVAGCPEECPYEHEFDLELQVDEVPAHGQEFSAFGLLTPKLNPADPHGEWYWSLQGEGADLLSYDGENHYAQRDPLQNSARLRVAAKGDGEAVIACGFRYGGQADRWITKLAKVPVGAHRVAGEVARSKTSQFRLERLHGYKHPWDIEEKGAPEELVNTTAWILYDFAVGAATFDPEKMPSSFPRLVQRMVQRVGEPLVFKPHGSQLNPTFTWLRKIHVVGFSDALGSAQLNDWLRSTRKENFLGALMEFFPALDPYVVMRKDLTPGERQAIDRVGQFVATNLDEEGRRRNRCVAIFELLEDATAEFDEQVEEHEAELVAQDRRERLAEYGDAIFLEWLDSLPTQGQAARETRCILEKAKVRALVPQLANQVADGRKTWYQVREVRTRGLEADSREVFLSRLDVDHFIATARRPGTKQLIFDKVVAEREGSRDLRDYRQSVVERTLHALDHASRLDRQKGADEFHRLARKIRDDVEAGVGRAGFFRQGHADGGGALNNPQLIELVAHMKRGQEDSLSIYSCLE